MADWAPEVAKRDFTIRDGADYDLAGTFRHADDPYADALAALGYTLTEQEPTS